MRQLESHLAQARSEFESITSTLKATEARNEELTKEVAAAEELRYRIDTLEAEGEPMSGEGELCLHAWRLAFSHPTSGEAVRFEAAIPSWGRAFPIG